MAPDIGSMDSKAAPASGLATWLDTVANMDAIDYLNALPVECVDLACVDPPYNLKKGEWDTWRTDEDFFAFSEAWITAMLPTLRPKAGIFIFNTPRNCAYLLTILEQHGCEFRNWITWDKRDGFGGTTRRFVPQQESILYFTAPGPRGLQTTFNADAVRVPYESTDRIAAAAKTGIVKNGKRWFPNPNGRLLGDVWHVTSDRHKNKERGRVRAAEHPTVKPQDLIERLVLAASNPGDVVLDPFAGSGTTAVVARNLGRRFLTCEADPVFVDLARRRLSESGSNAQTLF